MKIPPFSIELSDDATVDLDEAYKYYNEESPKVADSFFRKINFGFERIQRSPHTFTIAH